ncbi:hypothetical protein [Spiroplasma sp. DGKH1]|uniref:hypothetical protein n=1 Tax=Spiroplasma sp. DGKH1 TaxID=3050074 RepID=UPI0034C5F71E
MGLEFNNIVYKRYKKVIFNDLSFQINNKESLGVFFENKISQRYFLKFLLGKKKVNKGTIYLNKKNITTLLTKERKIAYVPPAAFRLGFLPTKLRLTYNILKTPKFLHEATIKYLKNKYSYRELLAMDNDKYRKDLINKVDKILEEYIYNSIKIKEQWMESYRNGIKLFHEKEIKKVLKEDVTGILFQTVKTYVLKKEELRIQEGYLAFLQALWDKIYYISELDYSCDCKYIAKRRKLKVKLFAFNEAKLICEKYLKILRTEIVYQRYHIFKARKSLKKYRFNVVNILMKDSQKKEILKAILKKRNNSLLKTWIQLSDDQWYEYNEKQEQLIVTLLPDEASIIKGKVIEYFHKYHLAMLNDTFITKKEDYSELIEKAKNKIVSVSNQAYNYVKELMFDLNIKMNWLRLTKNLSSFDHTKIRLINALLAKKELIVLHHTFDNLTQSEANELYNIINNIKSYNPQISVLVIVKNVENIKNYVNGFLLFDKQNHYKVISQVEATTTPMTLELYKTMFATSENIFRGIYHLSNKTIQLDDIIIKAANLPLTNDQEYIIAINPKYLNFEKTKLYNKETALHFKGSVKTVKKSGGAIVCYFETHHNKIFKLIVDYQQLNLRKLTMIYFEKGAVLVYDKETQKLLGII